MSDNQLAYHEIDFLIPAQRFKIVFSYISEQGLSFYREYILRLVHLAPMTKVQIATYLGFSRSEVEEAIGDLVERGELALSHEGAMILTEKSKGYFSVLGDSPKLASVQEALVILSFDLATFSCLGKNLDDKWKAGLQLKVDNQNVSQSELMVEKQFQRQFNEVFFKGYLPASLRSDNKEIPSLYIVDSVIKLRQFPLRLSTVFRVDDDGKVIERDDYDQLNSSEKIHEVMTVELSRLSKPSNIMLIFQAIVDLGDEDTKKLFNSDGSVNFKFFDDLNKLEDYNSGVRCTFIGPIYSNENTTKLYKYLAPILTKRISDESDGHNGKFLWIAPSDPFWGKSQRFTASLNEFIYKAKISEKKERKAKNLYSPILYVPLSGLDDKRGARQWENDLAENGKNANGLVEGFMNGNVEVMYLEDELIVVVYHIAYPDNFPITLPIGFISTDKKVVNKIGTLVSDYVGGVSSFDKPNDCGPLEKMR